ncbi:uncharacterized protein J7T54_008530 [Emericellopsis cladophorae]|uniref:Uncharacterized protein n=1 Tax=Emericellopsis cladophorae TaxID=2686198 RepID=A0A9P9XZ99_9HYPO|nr:uncharacterized protein J7T54_008530 [Emericellopsis cladophorae]KAI6780612.1 hypothetical protein J7T54_008530 [Emericellopsis cladophorae]
MSSSGFTPQLPCGAMSAASHPVIDFHSNPEGTREHGRSPGVLCPNCRLDGHEIWVIPGRNCRVCNTACDVDLPHPDRSPHHF